jgi:calpain-15
MLATRPEMVRSLFVNYSSACDQFGIYTLRFFKDGNWKTVTVDNRLPCTPKGQLLFSRCSVDPTEIWVPIVEKAYAKLHGNFEVLGQGTVPYALKVLGVLALLAQQYKS